YASSPPLPDAELSSGTGAWAAPISYADDTEARNRTGRRAEWQRPFRRAAVLRPYRALPAARSAAAVRERPDPARLRLARARGGRDRFRRRGRGVSLRPRDSQRRLGPNRGAPEDRDERRSEGSEGLRSGDRPRRGLRRPWRAQGPESLCRLQFRHPDDAPGRPHEQHTLAALVPA